MERNETKEKLLDSELRPMGMEQVKPQILEAFPEAEDDPNQLEELFAVLHDQSVEVYDGEEGAKGVWVETKAEPSKNENGLDTPDLSGVPVNDAIGLYIREMGHEPLLTREQEVELAKQLERGRDARRQLDRNGHNRQKRTQLQRRITRGEEARAHLIKANTRLVVSIAKRYRGLGLPFLDLIQAGNLGLIRAADGFDYRRGCKFGTYATWWMRRISARTHDPHPHPYGRPDPEAHQNRTEDGAGPGAPAYSQGDK